MTKIALNEKNDVEMSTEEVLSIIEKEDKVTIIMGNGFEHHSDTADVFKGLMGQENFEENEEISNALYCETRYEKTFILSNAKEETPFNELGIVKRIIKDKYWTNIILHDRPLKDGMYAMITRK